MKRVVCVFLLLSALCQGAYAQDGWLERDSLPVFVIENEELASIVDGFIADAKGTDPLQSQWLLGDARDIDDNSKYAYYIYIGIGDNSMSLTLSLREWDVNSDSLTLYKNPHSHQAFILHRDMLFRANVASSYAKVFNYDMLTDLIRRLPAKQEVFFKDPPPDFYDMSMQGGNPLFEDVLFTTYEYDGVRWHSGFGVIED